MGPDYYIIRPVGQSKWANQDAPRTAWLTRGSMSTKNTITNLYYDSEIARFNRPAPTHCSSIEPTLILPLTWPLRSSARPFHLRLSPSWLRRARQTIHPTVPQSRRGEGAASFLPMLSQAKEVERDPVGSRTMGSSSPNWWVKAITLVSR
jgi:hypothetical protein